MPVGLTDARCIKRYDTIYASKPMFKFMLHFEEYCTTTLSTVNILSHGSALPGKLITIATESVALRNKFYWTCVEKKHKDHVTPTISVLNQSQLDIFAAVVSSFVSLRCKDFVKKLKAKMSSQFRAGQGAAIRSRLDVTYFNAQQKKSNSETVENTQKEIANKEISDQELLAFIESEEYMYLERTNGVDDGDVDKTTNTSAEQ